MSQSVFYSTAFILHSLVPVKQFLCFVWMHYLRIIDENHLISGIRRWNRQTSINWLCHLVSSESQYCINLSTNKFNHYHWQIKMYDSAYVQSAQTNTTMSRAKISLLGPGNIHISVSLFPSQQSNSVEMMGKNYLAVTRTLRNQLQKLRRPLNSICVANFE